MRRYLTGMGDNEVARHFPTFSREDMVDAFNDRIVNAGDKFETEIKRLRRSEELTEEQLYFARELLEQIQEIVKRETKARDMRAAIEAAFENSMVEL